MNTNIQPKSISAIDTITPMRKRKQIAKLKIEDPDTKTHLPINTMTRVRFWKYR